MVRALRAFARAEQKTIARSEKRYNEGKEGGEELVRLDSFQSKGVSGFRVELADSNWIRR